MSFQDKNKFQIKKSMRAGLNKQPDMRGKEFEQSHIIMSHIELCSCICCKNARKISKKYCEQCEKFIFVFLFAKHSECCAGLKKERHMLFKETMRQHLVSAQEQVYRRDHESQLPAPIAFKNQSAKQCQFCLQEFIVQQIASHLQICDKRDRTCNECAKTLSYLQYPKHVTECLKQKVQCNNCHQMVELTMLDRHESTCLMGSYPCKYCLAIIENKHAHAHVEFACKKYGHCPNCRQFFTKKQYTEHQTKCVQNGMPRGSQISPHQISIYNQIALPPQSPRVKAHSQVQINLSQPQINPPAPQINPPAPQINPPAPQINLPAPQINLPAPQIKPSGVSMFFSADLHYPDESEDQSSFKRKCQNCLVQIDLYTHSEHLLKCTFKPRCSHCLKDIQGLYFKHHRRECRTKNNGFCLWCQEGISPKNATEHQQNCKARIMLLQELHAPILRLTKCQIQALMDLHLKSICEHKERFQIIEQRVIETGFKKEDAAHLSSYVENVAPIVIHFDAQKSLQHFLNDTQYRNQFQIGASGGLLGEDQRKKWESFLFGSAYDKAEKHQRVKYGVMNISNDPAGVQSCLIYGNSFLLLKEHVRKRCSWAQRNYNRNECISTLKYNARVLNTFTNKSIDEALKASRGLQCSSDQHIVKEVQIHGPIEFAKDVERIYVKQPTGLNKDEEIQKVKSFSLKFGVPWELI